MLAQGTVKIIILLLVLTHSGLQRAGGQPRINTNEIESLIDEWNFANNTQNIHSFEKVYGDRVTFYAENISKARAIALKRQLFLKNPSFRQRIITEVTYTPYTGGVVKCDFTKEVLMGTSWRKAPSYLLVSYENNRYYIVGEGDVATDRARNRKEEIGEPMVFEERVDTTESTIPAEVHALPPMEHPDSVTDDHATNATEGTYDNDDSQMSFADIDALFSDVTSLGMVVIPRGYLYILIGMLGIGGLMIFIADSLQGSRRRRRVKLPVEHAEAAHVVRDFRVQSAFESFVLTLFDPLYFKSSRPKTEFVHSGKGVEAGKDPELILDYQQKESHLRFGITCQYYQHSSKNEVQLLSSQRQELIRQFESERGMDIYYVLGFGGRPDDPKELFFVPAKEVRSEYMTRAQLLQFSKSGMFYYNRRTGRIQ